MGIEWEQNQWDIIICTTDVQWQQNYQYIEWLGLSPITGVEQ